MSTQGADVVGADADDIIDVSGHHVDSIDAGDGDDLISSERSGWGFSRDAVVNGGAGDDIFNVDIHAQSPHSADARGDDAHVIITDFDRTEDVLQISLPQGDDFGFANFEDYAVDGVTVEQDGDDSLITVSFVYDGPEVDYEKPDQATIIRVQGVSDLTLDEIVMEDNTDYVAVERPDFSVYGDGENVMRRAIVM